MLWKSKALGAVALIVLTATVVIGRCEHPSHGQQAGGRVDRSRRAAGAAGTGDVAAGLHARRQRDRER
jgi:hypothetical protein